MRGIEGLKKEQEKLAKKVSLKDAFDDLTAVAACDINYYKEEIIVCFTVFDKNGKIIDESNEVRKVTFPYQPGFLAYRESHAIIEAYYKLKEEPDLIMISRNGILHPRRFGLASHIGVALDKPIIGVAKSLLCGNARDGKVYDGNDLIGYELMTKKGSNPIYVSPGNKVSVKTAFELVKKNLRGHKMPEYLHIAHKYANKIKNQLRKTS